MSPPGVAIGGRRLLYTFSEQVNVHLKITFHDSDIVWYIEFLLNYVKSL